MNAIYPNTAHPLAATDFAEADQKRFWSKVDIKGKDECWRWHGASKGAYYGKFYCHGTAYIAHRIALVFKDGHIPRGLVGDHICRNKSCVNPSHLRAVTLAVNAVENTDCKVYLNALKTHCAKGHLFSEENTRIHTEKNGRKTRVCKLCHSADQKNYRQRKKSLL